jgi:3-oxoacyl-[acyl-carrier protein] reductase
VLARRGLRVIATDVDGERARTVARDLPSAEGIALDVTRADEVEAGIADVIARHERIDVLVNLAGVIRNELVSKIDDDNFALVMATHVQGTMHTMRAVLPSMRASGYGRIVNMSSIAARGAIAGGAYGAAKGAIEGLTRAAAMESARAGVTINCVAPGLIAAGMFLTVPDDYQRERAEKIPIGRAGTAEEVAACVAFLASPEASYVTGQTLRICGGLSLGF